MDYDFNFEKLIYDLMPVNEFSEFEYIPLGDDKIRVVQYDDTGHVEKNYLMTVLIEED